MIVFKNETSTSMKIIKKECISFRLTWLHLIYKCTITIFYTIYYWCDMTLVEWNDNTDVTIHTWISQHIKQVISTIT